MGQHAEDILNGDVDEVTGEWLGNGQGFPRTLTGKGVQAGKTRVFNIEHLKYVQQKLIVNGYTMKDIREIPHGYQVRTFSGGIVNVYTTGKINVQGKPDDKLKTLFLTK